MIHKYTYVDTNREINLPLFSLLYCMYNTPRKEKNSANPRLICRGQVTWHYSQKKKKTVTGRRWHERYSIFEQHWQSQFFVCTSTRPSIIIERGEIISINHYLLNMMELHSKYCTVHIFSFLFKSAHFRGQQQQSLCIKHQAISLSL